MRQRNKLSSTQRNEKKKSARDFDSKARSPLRKSAKKPIPSFYPCKEWKKDSKRSRRRKKLDKLSSPVARRHWRLDRLRRN